MRMVARGWGWFEIIVMNMLLYCGTMRKNTIHLLWSFMLTSVLVLASCSGSETSKQQPTGKAKAAQQTKKENPTATQEKPVAQPTETDERATYKEALKAEISDVNGKLPVDVETGIRVTKFTIEDNDAVYYYMCDESIVKMQAIEQSQSKMRKGTEESLRTTSDPETAHLLHMLNRAGMGLIFRYQGTQSGKAVDVRYSPEDVRQIRPE